MRLYLRRMSSVPRLTREDEIRIAKRIERDKTNLQALSRSLADRGIDTFTINLDGEINPQDIVDVTTIRGGRGP